MRPREYVLVVVAVVAAAVCVRLGVWQLSRLDERRQWNASVAARRAEPPAALRDLPRDTAALRFRNTLVRGTYDYAHEIVLTSRTRNGSPGVHILTPVRVAGSDTAVLVNRGWVYAADGVTADLTPWRESDAVNATGFVEPFGERRDTPPRSPSRPNAYRWLDPVALAASVPYPVYPYVVVLQGDTTTRPGVPPRVPPPVLDEGPHMSYAIQWFSFAAIALVGAGFFIRRARRAA